MGNKSVFELITKMICILGIFIMAGVIVMDLYGCGKVIDDKQLALNKLEEKYNKSFVVEDIVEKNKYAGYYTCLAYDVEQSDIIFRVNVDVDGNGFSDNYSSKCVFRKISDAIGHNLDDLDGYFYIYSSPLVERTGINNPEMTAEEYLLKVPDGRINVYLLYAPEKTNYKSLYSNLMNMYEGIGTVDGTLYLYITDEEGLNWAQDYLESHDQIYDDYAKLMKDCYKGSFEIIDGRLTCSQLEFEALMGDD